MGWIVRVVRLQVRNAETHAQSLSSTQTINQGFGLYTEFVIPTGLFVCYIPAKQFQEFRRSRYQPTVTLALFIGYLAERLSASNLRPFPVGAE